MPVRSPAEVGMHLDDVDTPALLLDLDVFERNLCALPDSIEARSVRIRPHAKSHKCPEIARRQIAAGAVGICCQKVAEAEAMVEAGIMDVFVSNEIVGAPKLARLAALATKARINVCADDARNIFDLDDAAGRAGARLDVLVEINVGSNRCGVEPGTPALALARQISACGHLRFAGLHAYHGSAQHLRTVAERRLAIDRAIESARKTKTLLAGDNLACEIVTGAGTGTYLFEAGSEIYNEIQPGSDIFMDADYTRNEWPGRRPPFEQSLFVWTTLMSHTSRERGTVDAGLKALSVDSGLPVTHELPGVEYVRASDEHGVLAFNSAARTLAVGEKIMLIPGHCDPTVNLYDEFVCIRGGRVEALWPITARGAVL